MAESSLGLPARQASHFSQVLRQLEWGALPLEVTDRLQRHRAEERGFPPVETAAEEDLPYASHHRLGAAGLEEFDGPEGTLPVPEQHLDAGARCRGGGAPGRLDGKPLAGTGQPGLIAE